MPAMHLSHTPLQPARQPSYAFGPSYVIRTQPNIRARTRRRVVVVADAEEELRDSVPPVADYAFAKQH